MSDSPDPQEDGVDIEASCGPLRECKPSALFAHADFDDDEIGAFAGSWIATSDPYRLSALVQLNPILSAAVVRLRSNVSALPVIADETSNPGKFRTEQQFWLNSLSAPYAGGTRPDLFSDITWDLLSRGECLLRVSPGNVQATFHILDHEWSVYRDRRTRIPLYAMNAIQERLDFTSWSGPRPKADFAIRVAISDIGGHSHSPLRAALMAQSVFDQIYQQALAILKNRPAMAGILSTSATMTDEQIKDLKATIARYKSGGIKSGDILTLAGAEKTNFKQFDNGLEGVLTPQAREDAGSDICIALGIPLELVGLGQKTYSNMETARYVFMDQTVLPLYGERIVASISSAVLPPFAPLIIDRDQIEVLRMVRITAMKEMASVPFLTNTEKRAFFGYSPGESA